MKVYEVFEVSHLIGSNQDAECSVALCSTLGKAIEAACDHARISCDEVNNSYAEGRGAYIADWTPSPCYGVAELRVFLPEEEEGSDGTEIFTYVVSERELI